VAISGPVKISDEGLEHHFLSKRARYFIPIERRRVGNHKFARRGFDGLTL
jgi:hypothetical protein